MTEFLALLGKIAPLYLIIFLGYLSGKRLKVEKETIANLLIYIIAPVVVFNGVVTAPLQIEYLALPLVTYALACSLSILFFSLSKRYFDGAERNLIAFMSGSGNTGYFGLPVVLALFGSEYQNIAILATLGLILFENTLGYYYVARHSFTAKEAFHNLLRLPAIYAYAVGILLNIAGFAPIGSVADNIGYFKGAYVVLGMVMIGLGLAAITKSSFDKKFIGISFLAKFIAYPTVILMLRAINNEYGLYDAKVVDVLLVLSVTPIASNTVAFATKLKAQPEKAALTVLLSTIFALVYIPIFVSIFIK